MPSAFRSVPSVCSGSCLGSSDVLGGCHTPTTSRLISPSSTLLASRVRSPSISNLLGLVPTFSAVAVYQRHGYDGLQFRVCCDASSPVDRVGRLALSASMCSRINRRHEGTSVYARTLEPARRVTAGCYCRCEYSQNLTRTCLGTRELGETNRGFPATKSVGLSKRHCVIYWPPEGTLYGYETRQGRVCPRVPGNV